MPLIEFAKKNSGALIVGVSLVIGLNFERFANYAAETPAAISLAIYHWSGQADADKAKSRREAAQRAEEEQARIERLRAEAAVWQAFLTAARTKFSQIEVVKNSYGGDYLCLRLSAAELSTAYQVRDNISDDFVQWLNRNRLLDGRDWKYDDLQDFAYQPYAGCWSAKNIWRANRYQNRID